MNKPLLAATVALSMLSADAASAQSPNYRPHVQSYRYTPQYAPRYAPPPYAYAPQPQRGPNPLDFLGAFFGTLPIGPPPGPPPSYPSQAPPYQQPPQAQYDPRDPNTFLEDYRVTRQEVEAAMQIFCSEHGEAVVCQKIENLMRQQRRQQ